MASPLTLELYRELLDYSAWARERVLSAAEQLSEADYTRPCGLDYPSIRATLVHQLGAEITISGRWQGLQQPPLTEEDAPTVEALRRRWREAHESIRAFVDGLSDDDLGRTFSYRSRSGAENSEVLWQSMFQIINHATQHRSEVALALTQMGRSPGLLDYIVFVRERARAGRE